jgi:hypothetical protein
MQLDLRRRCSRQVLVNLCLKLAKQLATQKGQTEGYCLTFRSGYFNLIPHPPFSLMLHKPTLKLSSAMVRKGDLLTIY